MGLFGFQSPFQNSEYVVNTFVYQQYSYLLLLAAWHLATWVTNLNNVLFYDI